MTRLHFGIATIIYVLIYGAYEANWINIDINYTSLAFTPSNNVLCPLKKCVLPVVDYTNWCVMGDTPRVSLKNNLKFINFDKTGSFFREKNPNLIVIDMNK